ncbi:MAG: DUF3047 domain-containing protein [Burkholderiales bacterium]
MHFRARFATILATVALVAGCALSPAPDDDVHLADVAPRELAPFSAARPGAPPPPGWRKWHLARFKKPTRYDLIHKDGATVVEARADASASALLHALDNLDVRNYRHLSWRWKAENLVRDQDNTRAATEDAPVRLVVRFDGDRSKLDFTERMFMAQVKAVTGQELPYATLMYIWARNSEPETVITSRFTERIRMIVATSGPSGVGMWQSIKRDLYADFRRAYGEEPGRITGIGIMTDTDNTGDNVRAWYGDITLKK